jgi:two-component system, OmpR family, sensor histidine kinase ChvG
VEKLIMLPAWSLKTKLLSILLLLFIIPLTSVYVLKEVEKTLVENLKSNLLLSANLINLQLSSNADWFNEVQSLADEEFVAKELFVFPLQEKLSIDGHLDDWQSVQTFSSEFSRDAQTHGSLNLILGSRLERLYLSLKVVDQRLIYHSGNQGFASDQLVISFVDNNDLPQRIFISPSQPGKVLVRPFTMQPLHGYQAYWLETAQGFNLEIEFPKGLKPKQLRVAYFDSDQVGQNKHQAVIATSGIELNPLTWPSKSIHQFSQKLKLMPGQRLWVLDNQGRVLAKQGDLVTENKINISQQSDEQKGYSSFILNWLFAQQNKVLFDKREGQVNLTSALVYQALKGEVASTIETLSSSNHSIAVVAVPVIVQPAVDQAAEADKTSAQNNAVVGVVLIEENVAKIQLLNQKSLGQFIDSVAVIVFIIFILITWYINRVSKRIIKLTESIQQAVDDDGRLDNKFDLTLSEGDEINQLSNAFIHIGNKLYDYNDYLEKLASRLSHELRTPIAIVRSSLDNLMINETEPENKQTLQRALKGTDRLGEIISRMRQASGVKQAMQSAEFELVDFVALLSQLVDGFNQSFRQHHFILQCPNKPIMQSLSVDLIAELLDKLLANAMDFCAVNKPIVIKLTEHNQGHARRLVLSVTNQGCAIEKKNMRKIFQSLVSIRQNNNQGLNLGLGLYVVKLIANFHGAKVKVENLTKPQRVRFSLVWNLNK